MWDLETIIEINKPKSRYKLWHWFNAWKKYLTNKNKSNENK